MNGLFSAPYEDAEIAALLSDAAWVNALVRVEAALARAQARVGIIPTAAANIISERAASFRPDFARLANATARDAFPIIGLVEELRAHCGNEVARFVHWGATTQDIVDTALVLQLSAVLTRLERRLAALAAALATHAAAERGTVMVGRTHLQPAVPITFGLKAAGWLAPLVRHRRRLGELRVRLGVVQFGGAAGTLASFGERGDAVAREFAAELGLAVPPMPWHAQRDNVHEAAGWLALVCGSAAKFTQDVLLLAQAEIGEVQESAEASRGGSSAMPQKANPVRCETVLVAARLVAAHHAGLIGAPAPEHERGTQTGQLELILLPKMCSLAGGALAAAETLARELVVDRARIRANLDAKHGVLLAEAVALALSRHLERGAAQALVREACAVALAEKRHLLEIVRAHPEAAPALNELPKTEADTLGSTGIFIDRVLAEAAAAFPLSPP